TNHIGTLKKGPDDKIYCANPRDSSLHVIHQPNLAGTTCQFEENGFSLFRGTSSFLGLSNAATFFNQRKIYHSRMDTVICNTDLLLMATDTSGQDYIWNNGFTGRTQSVDSSGTYWVSYSVRTSCMLDEIVDTFYVVADFTSKELFTATRVKGKCSTDTFTMKASKLDQSNYV